MSVFFVLNLISKSDLLLWSYERLYNHDNVEIDDIFAMKTVGDDIYDARVFILI